MNRDQRQPDDTRMPGDRASGSSPVDPAMMPRDLDAAWVEATEAVEALGPSFDLGVRRYPGGAGYAWCSGYLGEPPFLLEIHYPGEADSATTALRILAARLRVHADAGPLIRVGGYGTDA